MGPVHSEIIIIMKAFISLLSWPSLPQFLLKTPLRFSLPRQYSMQPSLLLRLVNTLVLPLFKALPLTWLIYPRLLRLRLLTHWPLMPTLLALSPSPLPLFSPEFNLLMLSHPWLMFIWLIYPKSLRQRLLSRRFLMPTRPARSLSQLHLCMRLSQLSLPPPLPLSPLPTVATPMPTTTVPTVPT